MTALFALCEREPKIKASRFSMSAGLGPSVLLWGPPGDRSALDPTD
jgi:hypothetical protein